MKGFLGFRVDKVEEVDSEAEFVPVEEILSGVVGRTLTALLMRSIWSDTDRKLMNLDVCLSEACYPG